MSLNFQELDSQPTAIGELSLRKRRISILADIDIYEIKLNDEYLMSSLFHEAEDQLATLALKELDTGQPLDVVVGGLGLGYTAVSALQFKNLNLLNVVEYLPAIIEWHQKELVPMGSVLKKDPRCHFVQGDFFALNQGTGFDPATPNKKFDSILLDIDHKPDHWLHPNNRSFYSEQGLQNIKRHLRKEGVFALWADGKPQEKFEVLLRRIFKNVTSHSIEFENPITQNTSFGTVYTAR